MSRTKTQGPTKLYVNSGIAAVIGIAVFTIGAVPFVYPPTPDPRAARALLQPILLEDAAQSKQLNIEHVESAKVTDVKISRYFLRKLMQAGHWRPDADLTISYVFGGTAHTKTIQGTYSGLLGWRIKW
ncbi:MAG: hypothetical protein K0U93_29605 [Gammaproteobacteria bacterium]|nr:hypothetical protein [Gammaproteobacteria bacterium]